MLMRKLGKIPFAIRMASKIMQSETTHSLYYAYFHSYITYSIIFCGKSPKVKQIFMLQKGLSESWWLSIKWPVLEIFLISYAYYHYLAFTFKKLYWMWKQIQIFIIMIQEKRTIFLLYFIPPVYIIQVLSRHF